MRDKIGSYESMKTMQLMNTLLVSIPNFDIVIWKQRIKVHFSPAYSASGFGRICASQEILEQILSLCSTLTNVMALSLFTDIYTAVLKVSTQKTHKISIEFYILLIILFWYFVGQVLYT